MASEVTSDLNSEISGLNNLCSSAFLAPKCFFEPFDRKEERKQNGLVDKNSISAQIKNVHWHCRFPAAFNKIEIGLGLDQGKIKAIFDESRIPPE